MLATGGKLRSFTNPCKSNFPYLSSFQAENRNFIPLVTKIVICTSSSRCCLALLIFIFTFFLLFCLFYYFFIFRSTFSWRGTKKACIHGSATWAAWAAGTNPVCSNERKSFTKRLKIFIFC